jgi:hypothetical protein
MARVSAVGTPSLTSAVVEYTQLRSLPIFSLRTISCVTMQLSVAISEAHRAKGEKIDERNKVMIREEGLDTIVICTDFQCLITSHDNTSFPRVLVLQESHVPCSSFFPLI